MGKRACSHGSSAEGARITSPSNGRNGVFAAGAAMQQTANLASRPADDGFAGLSWGRQARPACQQDSCFGGTASVTAAGAPRGQERRAESETVTAAEPATAIGATAIEAECSEVGSAFSGIAPDEPNQAESEGRAEDEEVHISGR